MRRAAAATRPDLLTTTAQRSVFAVNSPKREAEQGRLGQGMLGTADVVFMVMAAAAPMAVVVALMPLGFALGNGVGIPGTYLGVIAVMLLFAIGYVRIIPHIKNAGAFYAYISARIGRTAGLAAAYIAALCYFALSASTVAAFAFFFERLLRTTAGWHTEWYLWAYLSIILTSFLAYRRITLAATALAIALSAEVLLILILDFAIVAHLGLGGLHLGDFSPAAVYAPGLGIGAIYAFDSMLGIEGTAIYQEEARNARVTVPRATYISIVLVGLFYVFTAWCLTSSVPAGGVSAVARANPGGFVADRATEFLGASGALGVRILVLTSSLAAVLGLFNNSARYLYALARDGTLPGILAATHPRHKSPHVAAAVLTAGLALIVAGAQIMRLNPYANVTTALVGLGSIGLMTLLAVTSLGIPIFFARRRAPTLGNTLAPFLGGLVIVWAVYLGFSRYSLLTGVNSSVINHLPYLLLVVGAIGLVQAEWLRRFRPEIYRRIGANHIEGGALGDAEDAIPTEGAIAASAE